MSEWPYLMLAEALVFMLMAAAVVSLQNTLTGAAHFPYPVLASASLATVAASWGLGAAALLVLASTDAEATDGLASVCARSGRAAIGVVLMHAAAVAALVATAADSDLALASFFANHMFAPEAALLYYVCAIACALCCTAAIACICVAQHSMLRTLQRRAPSSPVPRLSWNVNLALLLLFESEVTLRHNAATAFAVRRVYASWQTVAALPALLLADVFCARCVVLSRAGVKWAKFTAVALLAAVVAAWGVLAALHPAARVGINAGAAALQLLCTAADVVNILSKRRPPAPPAPPPPPAPPAQSDPRRVLFDLPVRSGTLSRAPRPRVLKSKKNN